MSSNPGSSQRDFDTGPSGLDELNESTTAAFSPVTLSNSYSTKRNRSLFFVHIKTSLLVATPPQITRALACSHSFLLPLNKILGLVTWTSGDPWESFLLVVTFWVAALYGDILIKYAAPSIISIALLILLLSRRYPKLLSSFWYRKQKIRQWSKKIDSDISDSRHQKSLDEIVETLRIFTNRCHILIDPCFDLIETLESQWCKSVPTWRLLKRLLIRILLISILWIALNLESIQFVTTRRIILFTGTLFLTWHSQFNRISRTILWRSSIVRRFCSGITGLQLTAPSYPHDYNNSIVTTTVTEDKKSVIHGSASPTRIFQIQQHPEELNVKFTFTLYENQRRWIGLGWTTNLFAYERAAWTDEHQNPMPSKDQFQLPDTDDNSIIWKWVDGSKWLVEGARETDQGGIKARDNEDGGMGWIYYDSKWQQGRRGIDGWGCYTRRRKWYRDAELIEFLPRNDASSYKLSSPSPSHSYSQSSSSSSSSTLLREPSMLSSTLKS